MTMNSIDELIEKWTSITSYTGGFLLASDDHPLSFHIGYYNNLQKCFVVLNTGKLDKIPSSKAITVENVLLSDNSYALQFILNYSSLDEIFVKLCWDLMSSSKEVPNPLEKLVDQYKKWCMLLQHINNGLLLDHEQKGLIGELLYLCELIEKHGENKAINEWVGPEGADQDFNFDNGWAEIKTTSIAGTSVQISSLQQLDRFDDGILVVYFLDKTSSFGSKTLSLNEIVDMVTSRVILQTNRDLLNMKLAKSGYQFLDAEEYASERFKLSEKRTYRISDGFPRLIPQNIPPEIIEAKYKIDLPSIDSFNIREH